VFTDKSKRDLSAQLIDRGRRFGLTDSEIADGAARLIGALFHLIKDQGAGVTVGLDFLDKLLVGFSNPGSLVVSERVPDVLTELDAVARDSLRGPILTDSLPRQALASVIASPDNPIVIVTGPGGCGKTLSVLRAIRDHVESCSGFGAMLVSDLNTSLQQHIARWRMPDSCGNVESLDVSLNRIGLANENFAGVILVLGLDGLDEHGWLTRREHVRDLVARAYRRCGPVQPAGAEPKLIITCRNKRDFEDMISGTGTGGGRSSYREISLTVFEPAELRELWSRWFPKLPFPAAAAMEQSEFQLLSDRGGSVTAFDVRLANALRQPTMLGCFKDLTAEQQVKLLNGDGDAWKALLDNYLDWFARKVLARRNLMRDETIGMLSACAKATDSAPDARHDRETHWINPAIQSSGRARIDADRLFIDAVTAGLIITDAGAYTLPEHARVPWYWSETAVAQHLCEIA